MGLLKGYLRQKNVISENIVYMTYNFLFHGEVMPRIRDIQCFVSLSIPSTLKICDIITSFSTRDYIF